MIDPATMGAMPPAAPAVVAPPALPGDVPPYPTPGVPPAAGGMPPPAAVAPPAPPPATVNPEGALKTRQPAEKITNPFERTAAMIVQTADDWAKRLASNLGEHPSDYAPADNSVVHEMMHFSPYGADAPSQFWRRHDELLQMAAQAGDPDPYAVAERGALEEVYPYRAKIALLDVLSPEQRVARAEELQRISQRQIEQGNPHTALPSIVGPAGVPPPTSNGGGY